jgi:hypothetical protein
VISVRTGHPAALFSGVFDRANTFGFAI